MAIKSPFIVLALAMLAAAPAAMARPMAADAAAGRGCAPDCAVACGNVCICATADYSRATVSGSVTISNPGPHVFTVRSAEVTLHDGAAGYMQQTSAGGCAGRNIYGGGPYDGQAACPYSMYPNRYSATYYVQAAVAGVCTHPATGVAEHSTVVTSKIRVTGAVASADLPAAGAVDGADATAQADEHSAAIAPENRVTGAVASIGHAASGLAAWSSGRSGGGAVGFPV